MASFYKSKMSIQFKAMPIIFLLVFLISGCYQNYTVVVPTNTPVDTSSLFSPPDPSIIKEYATQTALAFDPDEEVVLYVILPNDSRVGFSNNDLKELPKVVVDINGREYQGVRVLDVLEMSKWAYNAFSITFEGRGSLTIPASQITEDTILVLNEQGQIDLISPVTDFSDLPSDVILITLH